MKFESCSSTCRVFWEFPVFSLKYLALCCCFDVRYHRTHSLGDCFKILDETDLRTRSAFDFPSWSPWVITLPAALSWYSWFEVSYIDIIFFLFVPWSVSSSASSSRDNVEERQHDNSTETDRSLYYKVLIYGNDMNRKSILRYRLKCIKKCSNIQLSRTFEMSKWCIRQKVTISGECLAII